MHLSSQRVLLATALASGCWGAPVDQSQECAAYVRCIEATDLAASPPQADSGKLTWFPTSTGRSQLPNVGLDESSARNPPSW